MYCQSKRERVKNARRQFCTEGQFRKSDSFARRVIFAREWKNTEKRSYKKGTENKIKRKKVIKNYQRK